MKTRELAPKAAVTVPADATIQHAAAVMDGSNVGTLLVLDGDQLVGIVTDRDIVVRGIARRVPADARIDGLMTTQVFTVDADADVHEALRLFESHAVRRLPVVDGGRLLGVLTVDDLLVQLAGDFARLVHPIVGELLFGHHPASVPAVR